MIYLRPMFSNKEEVTLEYKKFVKERVKRLLSDGEALVDSKKLERIIDNKFNDVSVVFDDNYQDIEKYYGILTPNPRFLCNHENFPNYIKRLGKKDAYEYHIHIFKYLIDDEIDDERVKKEKYLVTEMANALAVLYIIMILPDDEREKLFINDDVLFYNNLDGFSDLIDFFRINLLMPSSVFLSDFYDGMNSNGEYDYKKLRKKYVDDNCRDPLDFENRIKSLNPYYNC